jgi:surface antigen
MQYTVARRVAAIAVLAVLGACAQGGGYQPYLNKQNSGAVLGAVGGAVTGAQFGSGSGRLASTAVGTLLGAFVGSEIGRSLDRADNQYASQTASQAFNTGSATRWQNPESGNYGTVTPMRTIETNSGVCREFQQTVTIGGRTERAYGTACQQPDGSWKIIS